MRNRKITFSAVVLAPITLIYRAIIVARNLFFDWELLTSEEFKLPVISVGNITVGGTGKTPHVEYLVDLLKDEYSLAVLSRGYRRKTRHFMIAGSQSSVAEIGDEPRQLKQKYPEMIVAVDRKRSNGIKQLLKLAGPLNVILLDDAFQHRYVKPGKSILLIDYNRMITKDFMLPSGRLREPVSAKSRADIILVTKAPEKLKPIEMRNIANDLNIELHQHLFFTTITYGELQAVFPIAAPGNAASFKKKKMPVILLTGIANPRPLRKYARSISTDLHELSFPDHHNFTTKDLAKIKETVARLGTQDVLILTTEKDAMRLQNMDLDNELKKILYYVPIQVKFLNDDKEEFNHLILNYVRSNKRDNILHKEANKSTA